MNTSVLTFAPHARHLTHHPHGAAVALLAAVAIVVTALEGAARRRQRRRQEYGRLAYWAGVRHGRAECSP